MTSSRLQVIAILCIVRISAFRRDELGAHLALSASANGGGGWSLYKGDPGTGLGCNQCADVPFAELAQRGDRGLGCQSKNAEGELITPKCPLKGGENDQAGGHAGTFHKLLGNRVAKHTLALDVPSETITQAKIDTARTEWTIYMEMWCLRRLAALPAETLSENTRELVSSHPFRKFVLGEDPWAPNFHGTCRLGGEVAEEEVVHYLVMEDVLSAFKKPCQLDLKLGYTTVEPDQYTVKGYRHTIGDIFTPTVTQGARLAGYKVWNPFEHQWHKMSSKVFSPTQSISNVFSLFLDPSGYIPPSTLESLKDRLLSMSAWWSEKGKDEFTTVALSALMIRECEPEVAGRMTISDIKAQNFHWVGGGVSTKPYVTVTAFPAGSVYPQDEDHAAKYTARSKEMGAPQTQFVSHTRKSWKWKGEVFNLEYSPDLGNLLLEIRNDAGGILNFDHNNDQVVGKVIVPVQSGTHCVDLSHCDGCVSHFSAGAPQICVTLALEPSEDASPARAPVVKLIDYAHFYLKSEKPDFPDDGVDMGLLAAVDQFQRALKQVDVVPDAEPATHKAYSVDITLLEGAGMKCADNPEKMSGLGKTLCKDVQLQRKKLFMSWKQHLGVKSWYHGQERESGECRVCDTLVETKDSWTRNILAKPWEVFKLL